MVLECDLCWGASSAIGWLIRGFIGNEWNYWKILSLLNIQPYRGKYCSDSRGWILRGAYRTIDFSCAAKRRNINEIPSIIPIVFPLITGKLNITYTHMNMCKFTYKCMLLFSSFLKSDFFFFDDVFSFQCEEWPRTKTCACLYFRSQIFTE